MIVIFFNIKSYSLENKNLNKNQKIEILKKLGLLFKVGEKKSTKYVFR